LSLEVFSFVVGVVTQAIEKGESFAGTEIEMRAHPLTHIRPMLRRGLPLDVLDVTTHWSSPQASGCTGHIGSFTLS
jgi:hypothetical protein